MQLHWIDWLCIAAFFALSLGIGIAVSRRAGSSTSEYFAAGRHMPWWLLGISMVATTFSTGTPNLVTDIVRTQGVAGNWQWWAFLLTGMMTAFIYAHLWRRSGVLTDIEFYELRYSGKAAAFLRGFRALYLGILFNVLVMASVSLAAIKIGGVLLGLSPIATLGIAASITVVYSMTGGLRGVILTDFFQFALAMIGATGAAIAALNLPQVGGLAGLLDKLGGSETLAMAPSPANWDLFLTLLVLPLAVQWWSVWYPGSEPGGGGYVAQRMLSAKDQNHSIGAVFLFQAAHYALRPWPWILVALCSILVFPDLDSLQAAFPHIDPSVVKDDLAYPAMMTFVPTGLLGIVMASLTAAYMSTISTHLNWGASYVVYDFYKRFIHPDASERVLVRAGRIVTLILMVLATIVALQLSNALDNFRIMLQVGAGTGLLFILRWFWWRINAWSEISAMIISFVVAIYLRFIHGDTGLPPLSPSAELLAGVGITTVGWILVTFLTPPDDPAKLRAFCRQVRPGGPGWRGVMRDAEAAGEPIEGDGKPWPVPLGLVAMSLGCVAIYAALFATGYLIYGQWLGATACLAAAVAASGALIPVWTRLRALLESS